MAMLTGKNILDKNGELSKRLSEILGEPCRRVIIDIALDEPVKIYMEGFAEEWVSDFPELYDVVLDILKQEKREV